MTSPTAEVDVSTSGTSPVTSTTVLAEPVSSFRLISRTWSTSRAKSAVEDLNPSCFTSRWYFPTGSALKPYSPEALVLVVIVWPVPALVTLTFAPESTAPDGSVIVPVTRAVSDWANAAAVRQRTTISTVKNVVFIFPPIRGWRETALSTGAFSIWIVSFLDHQHFGSLALAFLSFKVQRCDCLLRIKSGRPGAPDT